MKAWKQLVPGWQRASGDLVALAQQLGRWPGPLQIARVDAAARVLAATETELVTLGGLTATTVGAGSAAAITATAAAEPGIIASQLPAAAAAELASAAAERILPTVLDVIRTRVEQAIVAQTRPLAADTMEVVRRELIRGVQLGSNPNQAARRMVAAVNGAFEGGLTRATTIARTEILDAHRVASRYAHEANADVLDGWTWIASLDRRACPSCWAMHGTTHPLDVAGPLDHPQGRCTRAPRLRSWRALGIDIDEPADQTPDARAVFDTLTETDRLQIMGAARLALLDSGAIDWADLATRRDNDAWRPSYIPTPVRDLQRLARSRTSASR